MKVLRHNQPDFAEQLATAMAASSLFDPSIEERARAIIADVQTRGDAALFELTERFDKVKLDSLVGRGVPTASPGLKRAIATAHKNIAGFARKSLRKSWRMRNAQGAVVGEKFE